MSAEESGAYHERLEDLVVMKFDDLPQADPPTDRPPVQERCNRDEYYELDVDFLEKKLNKGVVHIEFEKANGETRSMLCTRDLRIVPSDKQPKDKQAHKNNFSQRVGGGGRTVRVFEVCFTVGSKHQLGAVGFKDW
eukprot:CAMPEP_0194358122 /NCGR_PEP_ID=MMETSP0174-20130528/5449_1 /TAXON_ID=216777 /ORGANISM="Proboscia alata, Strain PI-D3" /LENGTH=135 /DNA_ID=CAMNT_0039128361 /DNA_START=59 /DNA_END=463 /DNA_ORIENTATION=+